MFQRNPKTAYATGSNYPAQENTGMASAPESNGRNPDNKRLPLDEYFAIMHQQLSQIGSDVAFTKSLVSMAEDRNTLVRITQFGTDVRIPDNKLWRTCYISRPSMSESLYTSGLTAKDLTLYFDDDFAVIVPYYGQIVIPVFRGYETVRAINAGPGGAGIYPSSWALDVLFTSRQYNPTQWAVSA